MGISCLRLSGPKYELVWTNWRGLKMTDLSLSASPFTENGFEIVYDSDEKEPIADGFYFTLSYPGFTGEALLQKLLFYGISAISLEITGSERSEGIRACVSLVGRDQFADLESRLKKFNADFGE